MKTSDYQSDEAPAPEPRDEYNPDAYEPPSVTELGSFRDLTGTGAPGKGQGGSDLSGGSAVG